jgi:DNA-binding CsgD family transcriptional regulator
VENPSDLLLTLYRAAREQPLEQFQDFTLRLIKPLLQFDGAFWGTGKLLGAGVAVHTAHLHEITLEHILEWQSLNPQDKVIPAVVASPGRPTVFHSPTLFTGNGEAPMRAFTKRAGWQASMVTAFLFPASNGAQWVSLYRPDPDHLYSDREQRLAQFLMPHLVEALTINRALHLQSLYGENAGHDGALAFCDHSGFLNYADPGFVSLLMTEWPNWPGGRIPSPLLEAVSASSNGRSYVGKSLRADARKHGDVLYLRARPRCSFDRLSPRESEVAYLFANGRSHKEIAKSLDLSPATVRHHLSGIYAKLDVHGKAQLALLVRQLR